MPVQFRCTLCRKKLKVSRRKSGTHVACPNCSGLTPVPTTSEMDAEFAPLVTTADSRSSSMNSPPVAKTRKIPKPLSKLEELPLFEREDFAELLEQGDEAEDTEESPVAHVQSVPMQRFSEPDTVVMSRSTLVMYIIAVVSLLALAFAAGFLVGSK